MNSMNDTTKKDTQMNYKHLDTHVCKRELVFFVVSVGNILMLIIFTDIKYIGLGTPANFTYY